MKAQLAQKLKPEPEAIRVTTPDVDFGFGMKAVPYLEYFSVAVAAMKLGRPVHRMSDHHGRDLTSLAELALDVDHRIIAYRGSGRPEATHVLKFAVDSVARKLNVDLW